MVAGARSLFFGDELLTKDIPEYAADMALLENGHPAVGAQRSAMKPDDTTKTSPAATSAPVKTAAAAEASRRRTLTDPLAPAILPSRLWAEEELAAFDARGLRRTLEPLESPQGPEVVIGGKRLINFSSNDYLGLAADKAIIRHTSEALERHGVGTGASRLVVGDTEAHHALEERLARWYEAESALLFNTGYACNVGVLQTLAGKGDVVFSDALNHASIIDGCRLSRAKVVIYPHSDVEALAELMAAHPGRRRIVVTDAVFSMDGDRAPLVRLSELCRKEAAALVVDEAHAVGVLGRRGAGLCEALDLGGTVDVRIGTLGKALGSQGAYAIVSKPLRELLVHRARSLVFSTALPAAWCAAAELAVERVSLDARLRGALMRNIGLFSEGLRKLGFPAEPNSAVFSVILGAPEVAVAASKALRERGLLVKAIRPPAVPEGTSRLRFALSAAHTGEHIDQALSALAGAVPMPLQPAYRRGWKGLQSDAETGSSSHSLTVSMRAPEREEVVDSPTMPVTILIPKG